ncbi:MAG: hypothetical protein A2W19_15840 [Spirochaetes bacterium RBG_16_49_21]|nr:MAG: hypothetical protein A2W19_15840 [Spirochaetes bacterium RBG_16_49_21]
MKFYLRTSTNLISITAFLILSMAIGLLNSGCAQYRIKTLLKSGYLIGTNLSGFDLYNLDLENANFSKARLIRTNFSFSNLRNSKFVNADLREADLSAADLTGSDLRGANLRRVKAENAVLIKANLIDAYFYDASLNSADLRNAVFVAPGAENATCDKICEDIRRGIIVNYVHLRNADLSGAAISSEWKQFIQMQKVRNFDKIVWVK